MRKPDLVFSAARIERRLLLPGGGADLAILDHQAYRHGALVSFIGITHQAALEVDVHLECVQRFPVRAGQERANPFVIVADTRYGRIQQRALSESRPRWIRRGDGLTARPSGDRKPLHGYRLTVHIGDTELIARQSQRESLNTLQQSGEWRTSGAVIG